MADSLTLKALLDAINWEQSGYTPKTEEEIEAIAQRRYASTYEQKRLSSQQAYETSDLALQQQLAGLQSTYDKQREQSKLQYTQAYNQADRALQKRGMQRSSYGTSSLAGIANSAAKAQQAISTEQGQQENNLNQQRTQLAQQLAQQLDSYTGQQLSDQLAYQDELLSQEYQRGVDAENTRNQLGIQLYQLAFQEQQAAQEQANWQAEYNAKYGNGTSSGGGGGRNPDNGTGETTGSDKFGTYLAAAQASGIGVKTLTDSIKAAKSTSTAASGATPTASKKTATKKIAY